MKTKKVRKLTGKELKFCIEYIKDWNATQAAIRAGYSKKSAYELGSRLLRKVEILENIDQVKENLEQALGISKAKVVSELMKIAFSSISDYHKSWIERKDFDQISEEAKACISEIDTRIVRRVVNEEEYQVEQIKIKLYDKQKALDAISKIMGYDAPVKVDASVSVVSGINVSIQKE